MQTYEIVNVSASALSIPTLDPFVIASGAVQATRSVLVRIELSNTNGQRVEGLGEAACLPPVTREDQPDVLVALQHAAPQLVGRHFGNFDSVTGLLDVLFRGRTVSQAGVEMALLDALSQMKRMPLFRLLSGAATPLPAIETDMTIPILPAPKMAELAVRWTRAGFRSLKVKVGQHLKSDLEALSAIRAAAPQASFRLDANAGLTVSEAMTVIDAMQQMGAPFECFEQPCATLPELAQVAAQTEVPIVADESVKTLADLETLISLKAADGVNLKVMKMGGLLPCLQIATRAREAKLKLMVGGMVETRLGMSAATHLVAALGGVDWVDLDTAWLLTSDPFVGGYVAQSARYTLTEQAGLQVSLKSEAQSDR
jgi:L-Ala-D/L-Glu epimerase